MISGAGLRVRRGYSSVKVEGLQFRALPWCRVCREQTMLSATASTITVLSKAFKAIGC